MTFTCIDILLLIQESMFGFIESEITIYRRDEHVNLFRIDII